MMPAVTVALAPIAIIMLADAAGGWPSALPDMFVPAQADVESFTDTALSLTTSLLSLAVGIVAGLAFLLREGPRNGWQIGIAGIGAGAAVASIYCSYRFQSALAEQLFFHQPDLARIQGRLDAQGWALLVSGCCLSALFMLSLPRTGMARTQHKAMSARRRASPKSVAHRRRLRR